MPQDNAPSFDDIAVMLEGIERQFLEVEELLCSSFADNEDCAENFRMDDASLNSIGK